MRLVAARVGSTKLLLFLQEFEKKLNEPTCRERVPAHDRACHQTEDARPKAPGRDLLAQHAVRGDGEVQNPREEEADQQRQLQACSDWRWGGAQQTRQAQEDRR